jgi:hypothetical protein
MLLPFPTEQCVVLYILDMASGLPPSPRLLAYERGDKLCYKYIPWCKICSDQKRGQALPFRLMFGLCMILTYIFTQLMHQKQKH